MRSERRGVNGAGGSGGGAARNNERGRANNG